jgi:hypothetical protein
MWITLWCITVAVLLLIIVCIGARLLGGLYGNVPSDVINVYQPPGTDFYITFKSPRMRGRFIFPRQGSNCNLGLCIRVPYARNQGPLCETLLLLHVCKAAKL